MQNNSQYTVMVFGAAGYGGSHLVRRLLEDGYKVVCVDRYRSNEKQLIQGWQETQGASTAACDITDASTLLKKLEGQKPDLIINASGRVPAATAGQNQRTDFISGNIATTKNIIAFAKAAGSPPLVQLSTCAARDYDGQEIPDNDPRRNTYAVSKYLAERLAAASGLEHVILRKPNIFGYRPQDFGKCTGLGDFNFLTKLARAFVREEPLEVRKDFHRDWLHIEDAVEAVTLLAKRIQNGMPLTNTVYEIGAGLETQATDFYEAARQIMSAGQVRVVDAAKPDHYTTDPVVFKSQTGWTLNRPLHEPNGDVNALNVRRYVFEALKTEGTKKAAKTPACTQYCK